MIAPDDASLAQMQAADPDYSVWLSANAGSGKTKVLTDRVARLLLEGVPPERILCLTYTKAAASEMQNRLFRTLGAWSMLEDGALRGKLGALGLLQQDLTEDLCRTARTLFARAIETPGGLKIQTIHSFCAGLLRRFPLEAEVSPQFQEMDSRAEAELLQAVLRDMASGPDQALLQAISRDIDETTLPDLIQTLLKHRAHFESAPDPGAIYAALEVDPDESMETLVARTLPPGDAALLDRVATACASGTATDQKASGKLRALRALPEGPAWLEALEALVLFGAKAKSPFGAKIDGFPTKATRATLGPDQDALNGLMARIEEARETRLALGLAAMTTRIHAFAHAFIRRYQDGKQARGWLDFDDLILRAQALLTDPGVAQWVLFRLDGGIDHMLVDEAQDTAPVQWEVIRLLTREFTAGQGARTDTRRTIFVVGDQKQSIYSFQGADPAGFDRMRGHFGTALAQVGTPLEEKLLLYSFRSSRAVLQLVDQTFALFAHRGLGSASQHLAFHPDLPGRVDLWPALPKTETEEARPWTDPVDQPAQDDARLLLARKIAREIRAMLDRGTQITTARGETRPVTPGDILILVQRRSEIFHELIRACKTEALPIAGSDRLRVGAELAVRDLMALLAFAATPEDSLSLACVLRSPLCGWSAAELHALAQPRKSPFLWAALRDEGDTQAETVAFLQDIRDQADFLRPYDLLDRILTRHGGRERLIARLGTEAEEGIDVLLAQALQYEQAEVPSLTGFVSWFRQDDMEIKRQIDARRDEIRVMTVHGAKGLEAPIVILPDCAKPRGNPGRTVMLPLPEGPLVWAGNDASRPRTCQSVAQEQKDRADDERMRLLYVALTRAESWLIVAAAGETGAGADSWHAMVSAGMGAMENAMPLATPTGEGLRAAHGDWPLQGALPVAAVETPRPPAPPGTPLAPPPPALAKITPSRLDGAKIVEGGDGGRDKDAAMARGDRIHRLLEHLPSLPRADWPAATTALLDGAEDSATCLAEAQSVLDAPALAEIFAPETLAEVDLTAPLPSLGGGQMIGTVDRLLVTPDRVLAVDFKTNAVVPDRAETVPLGLLRQMGAYAEALGAIYPDRAIETAILWTRTATLMPLPHKLVIEALQTRASA
ncbi:double-strand break repair helicase AddA [Dinoroseobacter sp. S375]|uniref:double-strand break repair helicase AddA n=1 Tax=Dinoroseobacter sp. S375 TaxID=3415136 RepID=UPI003C7E2EC4